MRNIDLIRQVKQQATGRWQGILASLGAEVPLNRHTACPACGGKDRFRFDDKEGNGTFICNQCGSGDGLDLVRRLFNVDVTEAAKEVAKVISIPVQKETTISDKPPLTDAIKKSAKLLEEATLGQSQYLILKGHTCSVKLLKDGSMILPVKQGDKLLGAQIIRANGEKRFISGTKKKGGYIPVVDFTGTPDTVLIAEGYATALTVSQLHEGVVLAALDEGNLLPVATWVRKHYPQSKIIIAADNDVKPDEANIGKIKAEKTAKVVNGWVTIPPTKEKADWDDYRQQYGIEAAKQAFIEGLYQVEPDKQKTGNNLSQMADNEKALLLAERYEGIAVHSDSKVFYRYVSGIWEKISHLDLAREMGNIYCQHNTNFSNRAVNNAVEALKIIVPKLGKPCNDVIPFANGVFNIKTKVFSPHQPDNWLLNHNGIEYRPAPPDENLRDHAPHFHKWLDHAANRDPYKMKRIFAALYMILANRYDWELFLEITGIGGSGKSVFAQIATLLVGEDNTGSSNMAALDTARGRAQFVSKRLITLPDQPKYIGEATGAKAITGGDLIEIDPKYEHQYSTVIRAVVIATNNTPMIFTERADGVARRRVIFQFNNKVKDEDKDSRLAEKISSEIAVIVRRLLATFDDPEDAKALLLEQRGSGEAIEIKRESDPLIDFCAYLITLEAASGMLMGNANIYPPVPRKYLYHAYTAYMQGNGNKNALSLTAFGRSINNALKELGKKYIRERTKHGYRTNLELNEVEAEDWLPSVP
ncbi:primase-helicase zinc-binding domain-containing protein [Arsenophonus nasoniae]|uniref:primase-helicase zinc-binding domain-containing protein n=1 Tax=Arsenophonus nasoniae TaxID=638 RepID=UPI003879F81F